MGPVPFTPLSASSQIPERDTAGLVTKSIQQEHGPRSVSTGDLTPGNNLLNRENVGQFSAGRLPEGKNNPGGKMASQETTPGSKPINTLAKLQPEEKPLNVSGEVFLMYLDSTVPLDCSRNYKFYH